MAVQIRSLRVAGPITIPLSSGRHVRLSPSQRSAELPDVEVAGNELVDRLGRLGVIEVVEVTAAAAEAAGDGETGEPERPARRRAAK